MRQGWSKSVTLGLYKYTSQHLPLSTSGFRDIGLGMGGGSGSLAIGSFLPVPMPNGFLDTGGVSQVAGLGFLGSLEEIIWAGPLMVVESETDKTSS